jgi:hypothetical protein
VVFEDQGSPMSIGITRMRSVIPVNQGLTPIRVAMLVLAETTLRTADPVPTAVATLIGPLTYAGLAST